MMDSQKRISDSTSAPRALWLALTTELWLVVMSVLLILALGSLVWVTRLAQLELIESAVLREVTQHEIFLREFRTLYTSEVTSRLDGHGVDVTHDYAERDGAIPLPATLTMLLAERIAAAGDGVSVRLYSDYPFPWRKGGPGDDFELEALVRLRQKPDVPFHEFGEQDGNPVLRYATADRMRESCVHCHNSHPSSPKRDWKAGDVRGVLRLTIPFDAAAAQANASLGGIFTLIVALGVGSLGALGFMAYRLRRRVRDARRTAERLGRYTLEARIGEGGMGEVYRAQHAMLRRPTAVKVLRRDRLSEEAVKRFEREVQLTSELTHPNTIAIYDFGRTIQGDFYYAMEYLDGISLDALVDKHGPQPEGRVIHLLGQICGSLSEAHDVGLIHRDIKPANIILCRRGGMADFVKVLDFGLVKQIGVEANADTTSTRTVTGTPLYMSPDLIQSPIVDARSDLYQVGLVGYYLLTGTKPFRAETVVEVCAHHLSTPPEPPSQRLGKPVSPDLEAILLRCLDKQPEERPRDAHSLASELLACREAGRWTSAAAQAWWAEFGPPAHTAEPEGGRGQELRSGNRALQPELDR